MSSFLPPALPKCNGAANESVSGYLEEYTGFGAQLAHLEEFGKQSKPWKISIMGVFPTCNALWGFPAFGVDLLQAVEFGAELPDSIIAGFQIHTRLADFRIQGKD